MDATTPVLPEDFVPDADMASAIERLDLYLRSTTAGEQVDGLGGRTLYVDRAGADAEGDRLVASPRVSVAMLRSILDSLALLDASTDEFRASILEDVGGFKNPDGAVGFDAVAYARHVLTLDKSNATRRAFDLCAALFTQIDQSGLSPTESAWSKRKAVQPLTDGQVLTADQLVAAVEAYITMQGAVATNQ